MEAKVVTENFFKWMNAHDSESMNQSSQPADSIKCLKSTVWWTVIKNTRKAYVWNHNVTKNFSTWKYSFHCPWTIFLHLIHSTKQINEMQNHYIQSTIIKKQIKNIMCTLWCYKEIF